MNALSWLAKQLAWEQRLSELRIQRPGVPAQARTVAAARRSPTTNSRAVRAA